MSLFDYAAWRDSDAERECRRDAQSYADLEPQPVDAELEEIPPPDEGPNYRDFPPPNEFDDEWTGSESGYYTQEIADLNTFDAGDRAGW